MYRHQHVSKNVCVSIDALLRNAIELLCAKEPLYVDVRLIMCTLYTTITVMNRPWSIARRYGTASLGVRNYITKLRSAVVWIRDRLAFFRRPQCTAIQRRNYDVLRSGKILELRPIRDQEWNTIFYTFI